MVAFFKIITGLIAGFAVGASIAGLAVSAFSGNAHDKALETIMTAVFAGGPAGAVIGAIAAVGWAKRGNGKT